MTDRLDKLQLEVARRMHAETLAGVTRRQFLGTIGSGIGAMALAAVAPGLKTWGARIMRREHAG